MVALNVLAALSLSIWIYLTLGRGGFWRIAGRRKQLSHGNGRVVIAVVPARNEAEVISYALRSLVQQVSQIVVVDDASSDGTADIARDFGSRVTVITSKPLAAGWTGKLWALSQGVEFALRLKPDYLLLTDADIRHSPDGISELVSITEAGGYDLASYMVRLTCESPAEKTLIPAFVFFFLMLYPPAWIASKRSRTAGAAGGCILIRPHALQRVGGFGTISHAVIDDCTLARAVKRSGGRIWMGLSSKTESMRGYGSLGEIGRMISRSAFTQLRHSALLLAGTMGGLLVTYIVPPIALFSGKRLPMLTGGCAWFLMSACYWPMVKFYRRSPWWSFALPVIAVFYAGATVRSALEYWTGKGGKWKGRVQDAKAP